MKTLYKFIDADFCSRHGRHRWEIGAWCKIDGQLAICERGFHGSILPRHAQKYVAGEVLALVEVRGTSNIQDDKQCWSEMRLVTAWQWTKEVSVAQAIFCAELVLEIFESPYPNDARPREAIAAAKAYLAAKGIEKIAAYAAYAADAADAAYAAYAAYAAADAAYAAYAAYAAADAAYAANAAAAAVAYAANAAEINEKIDAWFAQIIPTLEPVPKRAS